MHPANPNTASLETGRQHYPALDGLRGLAIILVVVYHNFGFINYFFFGWLGVDLFFVLSGFLITDILLKTVGHKNYLRNFYFRRILRIFPLYYLSLIIFLLIIPQFPNKLNLDYYTSNQVWLWTYLQNWLYIFNNPDPSNTLNHFWSLAVEEQFYLLWPFVILVIRKPSHLLIFITLLLLSVIALRLWIWNYQIVNLAYFNLYTYSRIDGICIGSIIAILKAKNSNLLIKHTFWIVLTFAFLNFVFFFINRVYNFTFPYLALVGYTTFAMMFGLMLNEIITGNSKILNNIFKYPILTFLGKISYGLYIFHWPVFLLVNSFFFGRISIYLPNHESRILSAFCSTLIAILISIFSFKYFETYFLKLKTRFL